MKTKKTLSNPSGKDRDEKSHQPPNRTASRSSSRYCTRAAEKSQMNEVVPRLNVSLTQNLSSNPESDESAKSSTTNRPNSGRTNCSFKEVVTNSPPRKNQFLALQDNSSDSEESAQGPAQQKSKLVPLVRSKTPSRGFQANNEQKEPVPQKVHQDKEEPTADEKPMRKAVHSNKKEIANLKSDKNKEEDTFQGRQRNTPDEETEFSTKLDDTNNHPTPHDDVMEGTEWTTVPFANCSNLLTASSQRSRSTIEGSTNEVRKSFLDLQSNEDNPPESQAVQEVRKGIKSELQAEMRQEIRRGFDSLVDYFEQHFHPTSVISIRSSGNATKTSEEDNTDNPSKVELTTSEKIDDDIEAECQLPLGRAQLQKMRQGINAKKDLETDDKPQIHKQQTTNHHRIPTGYYNEKDREFLERRGHAKFEDDDNSEKRFQRRRHESNRYQPRMRNHPNDLIDASDDKDISTLFGQNEFSLACTTAKIKYSDMNTFLKDKTLEDDTIFQLEKLYNNISRSLSFAFQSHVGMMPKFCQLTPTISFTKIFLDRLVGATLKKCRSIYDRLGEIIKDLLTSSSCIDKARSPKAFRIVQTNIIEDGWVILEKLLCGRVVFCGARPDVDLEIVLSHLTLEENESMHEFFSKTQSLINEFKLQYRNDINIPFGRIVLRFTKELMRAPEYIPYIANKYSTLLQLQKEYDRDDRFEMQDFVLFTVEQIYRTLVDIQAPDIPSKLTISTLQKHIDSTRTNTRSMHVENDNDNPLRSIIAQYETQTSLQPIIAEFMQSVPSEECQTPSICAFCKPGRRCHACLLGFHEEVNCFLRGQAFMPTELKQRINRYNATHGSQPPKDHKPPIYKPSLVTAPDIKNKKQNNNSGDKNVKFKKMPFSNNKTKQPLVNRFESVEYDEDIDEGEEMVDIENEYNDDGELSNTEKKAIVNAFVAGQIRDVDDNGEFYITDGDSEDPVVCVIESSASKYENTNSNDEKRKLIRNIDYSTPHDLLDVIAKFHRKNRNDPNQHFLRQHADKLSRLPSDIYRECGKYEFQIDSGANVGAINDRSLFYCYIPAKVDVEQAGGSVFTSEGWGGVLVKMDGKVRLHAPVHFTPNAPRNILSPGAMIYYSGFQASNHRLYQSLDMIDNRGLDLKVLVMRRNGLDFAAIEIMSFDHNLYDMKRSVPVLAPAIVYKLPQNDRKKRNKEQGTMKVYQSNSNDRKKMNNANMNERNKDKENKNDIGMETTKQMTRKYENQLPTLPRKAMSVIASFYVHLHPASSPRQIAISNMNAILGHSYHPHLSPDIPNVFEISPSMNMVLAEDECNIIPIINSKLSRKAYRLVTHYQEYILLHLGAMHASDATLQPMIKDRLVKDLPRIEQQLYAYNCTCTFCRLTKTNKLPRGSLVDYTKMQPFQQLHLDFSFYNHVSIRNMTSALGVVCAATSYPFGFPLKSKSPPLETIKYLIKTLRAMGYDVNFIRVDEDGALAKSAEFCRLIVQLNCVLQTTSGGNSESNGKVERPHQTQANMVRAALSAMEILIRDEDPCMDNDVQIEDFWCFAYSYAVHIQRRLYNKGIGDIPFYKVHGKRPSAKEMIPFGSIITVINPKKDKLPKLSKERAFNGYFLGFGNHIRSLLYWDPKHPRTYKRSYHAIIEDSLTLSRLQPSFSSSKMNESAITPKLYRELDVRDSPFRKEDIKTIKFPLPDQGSLGLHIKDDEAFNIPYLWKVEKNSIGSQVIPKEIQRNHFILHVNGNSPITSAFVKQHIDHMQKHKVSEMSIDLVRRGYGDSTTSLEITRAIFDQLPRLQMHRPIINSVQADIPDMHLHFIRAARKPEKPRFFHECLKSPWRRNWIAAAKIAFEKNQRIAVFSLLFERNKLDKSERVFSTVLVPEIKQTDIPGIWELRIRECIVGTKQQKSLDFEESYSPTVNETTVKIQIAFCAALNYIISIVDVKNAFQNTISKQEKRIYVTVPPTYLEWVAEFEDDFEYSKELQYVRQMLNANQGTRDAGNQWYILLLTVLQEYGLVRSTVDHGFFVRDFGDKGKLYVSLATDDLMCGYKYIAIFEDFVLFLRQFFTIVVQSGNILKFLGIRIIQSPEAISIDQGHYLYSICEHYFGEHPASVRTVSIPMRSDPEFEKELFESPPLSQEELVEYAIKYKGGFRSHIGKLQFGVITRFDFQFAVQRLSEYSCLPTSASFEGIDRVYRYVAQDLLRPIVFPKEKLSGSTTLTVSLAPEQTQSITFNHTPTLFTDAELGRDLQTCRSYYCIVVTLMGVIVMCKIRKSSSIMLHTTDLEAQASFDGVRRLLPIRALCEFMGYPIAEPSTHFVDNSAVHQIITSARMTPRCRHFDLPIAFLHEQHGKTYTSELVKTWLQLADIGTKPLVRVLHKKFKYFGSGERYLPKEGSQHWKDLEMQYYELKFTEIMTLLNKDE